mmetsp:Transcript_4544/g.6820  ORF Transcript_4544/g.6820 Transcript_4544/m.6820 type:complete len:432 (+) Transcript_4544:208-1503(+)
MQSDLKKKQEALQRAKNNFHKAHAEVESQNTAIEDAKKQPQFPPKQLSKMTSSMGKLKKNLKEAEKKYQSEIKSYRKFYVEFTQKMHALLHQFQETEMIRLNTIKEKTLSALNAQHNLLEKEIAECDKVVAAAKGIDRIKDLHEFLAANNTQRKPDALVEYEQYEPQYMPKKESTFKVSDTPTSSSSSSSSSSSVSSGAASHDPSQSRTDAGDDTNSSTPRFPPSGGLFKRNQDDSPNASPSSGLFKRNAPPPTAKKPPPPTPAKPHGAPAKPPPELPPVPTPGAESSSAAISTTPKKLSAPTPQPPGSKAVTAKFDFEARDSEELSFKAGDMIYVTKVDSSGWWDAQLGGEKGLIPCNRVSFVNPDDHEMPQVKVLFEYTSQASDELTVKSGEMVSVVLVHGEWKLVKNAKGEQGLIPGVFTNHEDDEDS